MKKHIKICFILLSFTVELSFAQYAYHTVGVNGIAVKVQKSGTPYCSNYNNDYTLTFAEEFNGSVLDNKIWAEHSWTHKGLMPDENNNIVEIEYYAAFGDKPDLFELANGKLKIYAKQIDEWHIVEGADPNPLIPTATLSDGLPNIRRYKYASGTLDSYRNFKYGFYEMSCKLPTVDGVWPAFWLFGQEGRTELDIFEFVQVKTGTCMADPSADAGKRWYTTYHDWENSVDGHHDAFPLEIIAENFSWVNDWHRFGMIWDDYKMIWLFDGVPVRTVYHYEVANGGSPVTSCDGLLIQHKENINFPIEQCFLSAGMSIRNFGGAYGDPAYGSTDQTCSSPSAVYPTSMEIDWIHVYEDRSCQPNVTIDCSQFLPSLVSSGQNLTLAANNCEVAVRNIRQDAIAWGSTQYAHTVYATANEKILMQPGFRVEPGANFKANITNCSGVIPWGYAGGKIDASANKDTTSAFINRIKNYVDSIALAKNKMELGPEDLNPQKETNTQTKVANIKIIPNPNMGIFTIESSFPYQKIQLFDVLGKLVLENNSGSNMANVTVDNFNPGVYLLKITDQQGMIHSEKIYLQK